MQWEYMVFRELPEEELNEIGDEGWDIVTAEFAEEGVLTNVLAKRSRGRGDRGRGGGGGGRGRRRGPRIGVMGGTSIDDTPGY